MKECTEYYLKEKQLEIKSNNDDFDINRVRKKSTPKVNVIYKTY